jgi:hypothetical protein
MFLDSDSDSSSSADEVVDDSMTVDAALVCSLKEALGKAAETSDNVCNQHLIFTLLWQL